MEDKGLKSHKDKLQFLIKLGFSYYIANKMIGGKMTSFSPQQMTVFCQAINCTPNDILDFKPRGQQNDAKHSLMKLVKLPDQLDVQSLLLNMSLEQIEELKKSLNK